MPRRGFVSKRVVSPDPVYGDVLVAKMIHAIMLDGKARVAENVVYGSLDVLKARRVGGATYQVPIEIRPERRQSLSIRWLVGYARERAEKTMIQRLSGELLDAYNNRGNTFKKKEDTHKMAEANKAFAHYRW
jgi:small subunit ribosomal protein S7